MEYTTNSVLSLISRIHTQSAEYTNKFLAEHNFVSSHGFILFLLKENEKLTMGEIATRINRDKSTTTVLVKKLIDENLVKTEPSKTDNRKKIISLTDEGKKYNNFTSEISKNIISICYKDFSESEKEELLRLLKKMSENLK